MESPFSLLLEKILKSFLQDYIKKDGLILDSFSFLDTNFRLKNVELKNQIKEINNISIELLNGIIYDVSIEGSILQNNVNIELSNISICLYIPSLEELLYSYPKSKILKYDPCLQYSFKKNQINNLFSFLCGTNFVKLKIYNLSVNLFINIESILVNLSIHIDNIYWKTVYKENDELCTSYLDIKGINLSVNFTEISLLEPIKDIINRKGNINNECQVIKETNLNLKIIAYKYRFEKVDYTNQSDFDLYENFSEFNQNNKFILNFKGTNLNISNLILINILTIIKKIEIKKQSKLDLLKSGKAKLNRIKNKFVSEKNIIKNKGYKFKNSSNVTIQTYITIFKYLTYISLIMKQKKIIDFDLNFYTCEKLITEYRFNRLKEEHFILDYLIEQNVSNYVNSPPISGSSSIFLNMDNFKDLKLPTQNKTLKAFMLFILEKFIVCKKCLDNYASYDDFYFFHINFDTITLDLTRKININNDYDEDYFESFDEDNDELYINNLEKSIRSIRDNVMGESFKVNINDHENYKSTNILFQLKIDNFNTYFYTNVNEHFLLKVKFLSLKVYNYSYIDISNDINLTNNNNQFEIKGKENKIFNESYFSDLSKILSSRKNENESNNSYTKKPYNFYVIPLLKIEYDSEIKLFIINQKMTKLQILIADIILLTEVFSYYLTHLFFINITRPVKFYNNRLFFPQESKKENIKEQKEEESQRNIIPFESFSVVINQIIISMTSTNHTEISLSKETLLFQLNNLNFTLNQSSINFGIEEIILGCIKNYSFYDFYNFKSNLVFQTTIFNIFDINQTINFDDFNKNKAEIPLNSIIIEITKKDIDNLYTFYASFVSLEKLMAKFDNNDNIIIENLNIKSPQASNLQNKPRKRLNSYQFDDTNFLFKNLLETKDLSKKFCLFKIDKIIIYIRLDKLKPEEELQNNPEKVEFKHIITIINKINFVLMSSKNDISFFLSFDSIHIFHQNKYLLKLLESKDPYSKREFNKHSYKKSKSRIIINDDSENNKHEIQKYIQTYTHDQDLDFFLNCSIFFTKNKIDSRLYIFMPIISLYFDYILFRSFLNFLNFEKNKYINHFNECILEQLAKIMEMYRKRYNVTENGILGPKEKDKNAISIYTYIYSIEMNFIEKRKLFMKLKLYDITFSLKNDFILFSSEIKSLSDEREISEKKRIILQKKPGAQKLDFSIKINLTERNIYVIFEKAKFVFLMRIINDMTEYFWRIIFLDIYCKTDYESLYKSNIEEKFKNAEKKDFEEKQKLMMANNKKPTTKKVNSLHRGSIYAHEKRVTSKLIPVNSFANSNHLNINFNNNNSSAESHHSKFERNSRKHFTNIETSIVSELLKHKEKTIFSFNFLMKDSEMALCMNSLKDEELIASFSEFEVNSKLNEETKIFCMDYFNKFKRSVFVFEDEKTFDLNTIDYFINFKDLKIKKAVDKNITNNLIKYIDVVNFNSKKESNNHNNINMQFFQNNENSPIGSITILLENKIYEDILSTMRMVVIIPSMRIKLYTDIYEELMRLIFENFGEANTIISECTNQFYKYFNNIDYSKYKNFQQKKFLIGQDMILLNEECYLSLYNYPAKCSFHRVDRKTPKQHNYDINCNFGKNFPNLELEKLCEIKLIYFYLLMRFFKIEKYFYVSFNNMKIELNKNMLSFSQYPSIKLLWIKTELLKKNCFNLELTLGKNLPTKYDVKFYNMNFTLFPLPIISIWRFFTKYFFYYTNTNIKNILHKDYLKFILNTTITLKDCSMIVKSLYGDSVQQQQQMNPFFHDLQLNFDLILKIINTGNTITSPFTSFTQYIFDIKSGFLNGKEDQSQFLDKVKIVIEIFSKGKQFFKENDRTCYYFIKYGNEKNDLKDYLTLDNIDKNLKMTNDVNVKKDNPQDYRNFISKYKFKEEEEINFTSFNFENDSNKTFNKSNYNSFDKKYYENNTENDNYKKSTISNLNEEEIKINHNSKQSISYKYAKNNNEHNILFLSLNFLQIHYTIDMFSKISKNYSDNAKFVLQTLTIKTQFNDMVYKTAYGIYINQIDIRLCDSQFNAQLFQIVINKLMFFQSNNPNNQVLNDGLKKLLLKYSDKSTGVKINMEEDEIRDKKKKKKKKSNNEKKENEEYDFTSELLMKFILKVNYHNSNQSNDKNSKLNNFPTIQLLYNQKSISKSFTEEDLESENNNSEFKFQKNNFKHNDKSFWEPVIEPMPGKFTYLTTKQNQFIKFEILSLKPTYDGLRKICRQNNFHSLNINLNERLMENINSLMKDYYRINEIMENKELNHNINNKKTLTVLNLTEYFMLIKENSNFKACNEDDDYNNENNISNSEEENEINTHKKKKIFEFSPERISSLKNEYFNEINEENDYSKKKFEFIYKPSKKIHDKDELEVYFQENLNNNEVKNSSDNSPYVNPKKLIERSQTIKNQKWKVYNIERPSKFFYIQKFSKEKIDKNEEKEELKKNFDNKASILLKGEHFLVCEIEIDSKSSRKLVTFRSNEGIKNELDFPVRIKFILKDKAKKSDIKIILYPGKYFYIPPSDLENIKEILIKPFMNNNDLIKFGNSIYPYCDLFFHHQIFENEDNKFYISHCPIKEIKAYAENAEKIPINDEIIFVIVKKYQSLENEFLSEQIKEKIDFIKAYRKYNYEQGINKNGEEFDTSKLVSDITYVLTPIMKFYNNLPRCLTITKHVPFDYYDKDANEKTISEYMKNIFDVENYIKEENESLLIETRKKDKETVCIQEQYVTSIDCNYENYKINRKKKNFSKYSYNLETTVKSGDYMSIYEPFILTEKGESNLHFIISVIGNNINENDEDELILNEKNDKKDYNENKNIVFDLKPFFFNSIIKCFKKSNDNLMSFPRIIKNSTQTLPSKRGNYFLYSVEVNENYVLNSFFYCPFLFLNCSDMNLQIRHKDYVKTLYCKKKKSSYQFSQISTSNINNILNNNSSSRENDNNDVEIDKTDLNRVVMFNPSKNNHFSFEIGNVNIPIYDETNDYIDSLNRPVNNNINNPKNLKILKKVNLKSQWKKIHILDISKLGGITVDLTGRKSLIKKIINKSNNSKLEEEELKTKYEINENGNININDLDDEAKNHSSNAMVASTSKNKMKVNNNLSSQRNKKLLNLKIKNINKNDSNNIEELDQKLTFSLQIKLLPKSTLIFITASIYILNQTQKDIYIYYLPIQKNDPIKSYMLKAMSNSKFNYKVDYYSYVQLSYEDKYVNNDRINFSGLIDFSQDELKNKEFNIQLGEKKKEPLLVVKIIEINGFKFVLLNQKENVNQYPYLIINKLNNKPVEFKQKENINDKNNEILNIYKKLDKDYGIEKKIISHRLKEYIEPKNNSQKNNITNINITQNKKDISSNNINQNSTPSNMFYTWEEPLLYDQDKNTNILEIKVFGAKFEIDPQEIQNDVTFDQRIISDDKKSYLENIIDDCVSKGKIRIVDKKNEYQYELYKHALVLKSTKEGEEPLIFEFHNQQLICERKYNGNFSMKLGLKEYEMLCVSMDETNILVDQMSLYFKKSRDFASNFVIKKHVKNKCIYVELMEKVEENKNKNEDNQNLKTHLFFNIENICISFIMKHKEFMYIWLKAVYLYLQKTYGGDNTIIYKQIIFKIKEYQIDNYAKRLYYPILFSPLSDKRFSDDKFYSNFSIVLNNFQMNADLYQVDLIYVTMMPIDIKLENKFLENLNSFIIKVRMAFDNKTIDSSKNLKDYVHEIDNLKFIEYQTLIKPESRIHVKLFCIDEIKTYFSLKFDNIDLFLETSSFLFLKPLIEELGLRILNLESSIFSFPNYIKVNIYQSTNTFSNQILSFYFQLFVGELIKALGGIHSISSFQLWENLNNNFLSSMKNRENSLEQYKSKKSFKEIYRSGYENASTVIGGFFILTYKMMATIGRIFAMMTIDEKYKKRRTYLMNKSVKSLGNGITLSVQLLICAIFYILVQFYYVPKNYIKKIHFLIAIFISIITIAIGIVWKPICGVFDFFSKIFETLGVSIIDILAERIRIYARFPREIKDNNLRDYNSIDALASFAKKSIDKAHSKAKTEDVRLAIPGIYKNHKVIVLFWLDRILVVRYIGELKFQDEFLFHFSSYELYFDDNKNYNIKEIYDWICFHKKEIDNKYTERSIEILIKKRRCFSFVGKRVLIKLNRFENTSYLAKNYDQLINEIIKNKKEVKERFSK